MAIKNTKADLVLHPIRIRILMALAGEHRTSQQLADDLRDIPQATLYRHIARLAKAGIIEVAEVRQVRGTAEKVYTLDERTTALTAQDVANFSKDDHMRSFIAFIAALLDDFSRYIQHTESIDVIADGVSFHKFPLYLSDEELASLSAKLNAAFAPYRNNQPGQERLRRIFSIILLPDVSKTGK